MASKSKSLIIQDGEPTDVDGRDKNGIDNRYTVSPIRALLPDKGARKKGSHEHIPTEKSRKGVMHAVGLGMNRENIAKVMGISVTALKNHYKEELDIGLSVLMDDVKTNMYNIARDPAHKGTVQAGIYLLSRLGGENFKEVKRFEMTGADGKALEISHQTQTVDPRLLDADQREALRDILNSALRLAAPTAQAQDQPIDGEYEEVEDEPE
jgi:hypothetical protein